MTGPDDRPYSESLLFKYGPVIGYCLVLAILLESLLGLDILNQLRWQHVVLIGGLLLIPFIREIDRVFIPNVGGVQMNQTREWKETMQEVLQDAEISSPAQPEEAPEEDTERDEETETEPPTPDREREKPDTLGGNVDEIANEIYSLAEENPRLAISKLGTELEHGLRHLLYAKGKTPSRQYHQMLNQLRDDSEIDSRFLNIAEEIRYARNNAVHSAEFDSSEVFGLIDVGLDLLRYINKVTESERIPENEPPTQ